VKEAGTAALPESGAGACRRDRRLSALCRAQQAGETQIKAAGTVPAKTDRGLIPAVSHQRVPTACDAARPAADPEENGAKVESAGRLIKRAQGKGISVDCRRVILAEAAETHRRYRAPGEPLTRHGKRELKPRGKGVRSTPTPALQRAGSPTCSSGRPRSILEANATAPTSTSSCQIEGRTRVIEPRSATAGLKRSSETPARRTRGSATTVVDSAKR